jgi:protein-disulfide isomerase
MKKIGIIGLIFSFMVASSLFGAEQAKLKQDISKIFTGGKLDKSDISIIAEDSIGDLKDLRVMIGTIKGNPKPFLIVYNKDTMIVGSMKNRKNGDDIFASFIKKSKTKIEKALKKMQKNAVNKDVKNNKKLISLFANDYKDMMFKIKGGNPKGKTVYLITDPNCPYCQRYEKNELANTIKKSKEIRVIPLFLNIPGHETSPMRASWLLEKAKNDKNADMFSLMRKASNINDNTYKEVNKKFAKERIAQMKKLLSLTLFPGTPTIFDQNGTPTR